MSIGSSIGGRSGLNNSRRQSIESIRSILSIVSLLGRKPAGRSSPHFCVHLTTMEYHGQNLMLPAQPLSKRRNLPSLPWKFGRHSCRSFFRVALPLLFVLFLGNVFLLPIIAGWCVMTDKMMRGARSGDYFQFLCGDR